MVNDEENNSELYVYNINGNFMLKKQEYVHLTNPVIIKDIYSFEYLAFLAKESIIIRKLPNLDAQVNIDCFPDIHSFCISEDNKTFFTINKSGKKLFFIKE